MSNVSLWTRRDPFAEFDAIVRRTFGPDARTNAGVRPGFTPAAEIVRDGDDAVVRLELPGVDTEKDVVVELDRGRLVVRGERRDPEPEGRTLREVRYGAFRRSFGLPPHVKADALSASYDAGVLSVRVAGAYAGTDAQRIAVTSTVDTTPEIEA
ncbi:Hsp20/alpha crystallin family protein [Hamadaea tsunoensis]|uniref:Hsp20/alpha crystallin family protein n=1 Tax=Hamadaea tsunoensis TaxID=53368 RepID=UPI00041A7A88|nr:Hsp20/alpha crystallin family protein [Hamadaea tsunoensis]